MAVIINIVAVLAALCLVLSIRDLYQDLAWYGGSDVASVAISLAGICLSGFTIFMMVIFGSIL